MARPAPLHPDLAAGVPDPLTTAPNLPPPAGNDARRMRPGRTATARGGRGRCRMCLFGRQRCEAEEVGEDGVGAMRGGWRRREAGRMAMGGARERERGGNGATQEEEVGREEKEKREGEETVSEDAVHSVTENANLSRPPTGSLHTSGISRLCVERSSRARCSCRERKATNIRPRQPKRVALPCLCPPLDFRSPPLVRVRPSPLSQPSDRARLAHVAARPAVRPSVRPRGRPPRQPKSRAAAASPSPPAAAKPELSRLGFRREPRPAPGRAGGHDA
uniref:Uncharacterized protein n=1 Tax=Oryza punctata TaxID=4537 RepID=A0A0E0JMF6_ORYPU